MLAAGTAIYYYYGMRLDRGSTHCIADNHFVGDGLTYAVRMSIAMSDDGAAVSIARNTIEGSAAIQVGSLETPSLPPRSRTLAAAAGSTRPTWRGEPEPDSWVMIRVQR